MIKPLTSLRFFFALMVFTSHLDFFGKENLIFHKIRNYFFYEGYIGVSFFFILSGFILSLTYKNKIINKQVTFKDFWLARIARIYPLHLLTLFIAIPLSIWEINAGLITWCLKLLFNLLLLQSFIPLTEYYFTFNMPSWSISSEMFFYLMFPIIIHYFFRHNKLIWLITISTILIILIPAGIYLFPTEWIHRFFYINPIFRLVDFIIGILIFELYKLKYLNKIFSKKRLATSIEFLSLIIFSLFFAFHEFVPQGYRFSCYYWAPMVLIILSFAYQNGYLSKLLSNKHLILLGEISFGFYLIHHLAIRYILTINTKFFQIENDYLLTFIIFSASIIASYITYKFIEIPANKYIKERFRTYNNSPEFAKSQAT